MFHLIRKRLPGYWADTAQLENALKRASVPLDVHTSLGGVWRRQLSVSLSVHVIAHAEQWTKRPEKAAVGGHGPQGPRS